MEDVVRLWSILQKGGISQLSLHVWMLIVAGVFVSIAVFLSAFLIFEHLISYTKPEEQTWIIAVLFMVPVYASQSFVSLWKQNLALACGIFRDCYEAFVLYAFFTYLIACLGGEDKVPEVLGNQSTDGPLMKLLVQRGSEVAVKHPAPFHLCFPPWTLKRSFYTTIKFGVVQYMILKTLCALLALLLENYHIYGEGRFRWYYGYPYITVVLNFSQTWALYCLVQFYAVTRHELREIKPLAKFLCVKAVVFATYWQGVLVAVILGSSIISIHVGDVTKLEIYIQNFILCIEMAIAAVAHIYAFSAAPYQTQDRHRHERIPFSADYESSSSEFSSQKVKESENHRRIPFLPSDFEDVAASLKANAKDMVLGGGEQVIHDVKLTISQAAKPVEKGIDHLHDKLHELRHKRHEREKKNKFLKDDGVLLPSSQSKMQVNRES